MINGSVQIRLYFIERIFEHIQKAISLGEIPVGNILPDAAVRPEEQISMSEKHFPEPGTLESIKEVIELSCQLEG
jgi:hypothetical protein